MARDTKRPPGWGEVARPMQSILLCVDRDEVLFDLLVGFRYGVRIGAADRVLVCHVLPKTPWMRAIARVDPTVAEQVLSQPTLGDRILSDAVEFLEKEGVRAEPILREGDPADEIERLANEESVDLLVTGSLGRANVENLLLGSVSRKLARRPRYDVFVVHGRHPERDSRYGAVVAVDASEESLAALNAFSTTMDVVLADVHLVSVAPRQDAESASALERAAEQLDINGLRCTTEVRYGRAAREIVECAKERDAGLVVVGARKRDGLSAAFHGSVSRSVLDRAPCSVFCAPARS